MQGNPEVPSQALNLSSIKNSPTLPYPPQNLLQVAASGRAFAAILTDGSVVAWGDPVFGGRVQQARRVGVPSKGDETARGS